MQRGLIYSLIINIEMMSKKNSIDLSSEENEGEKSRFNIKLVFHLANLFARTSKKRL